MDTMRLSNFGFIVKKAIFILFLLFKWLIKGLRMTVIQLVKSIEKRIEIRDYIVHFIDGSQCDFLKLNANELNLEVTSFHWNNHNDELHIYVEEVM